MPSITFCTDQFTTLARSVAKVKGLADLPLVIVPHPVGGLSPQDVRAKAEKAVDEMLKLLG